LISDAEKRRLAEIESVLRRDDPAFARHFDRRWLTRRRRCVEAILGILIVLAVSVIAGVLGGAGTAVIVLSVLGSVAISFGLWRSRPRPSRRSR
jgi:hypothetical protein